MINETSLLRVTSQWLVAMALTLALVLFFASIVAVQLTSEGTGQRILRRAVATTTQIDTVLPAIHERLRQAAADSGDEPLVVPDFPIAVELSRQEASTIESGQLRERLLDEAARRLYEDGSSAWATSDREPGVRQDIEIFSAAGLYGHSLDLVSEDNHRRILIAAGALGVVAFLLGLLLVTAFHSYARLAALGAVILTAALPSLAAAVAVRFAMRTAEEETDPFASGLIAIGVDAIWVPLRDYLALSVLGAAIVAVALLIARWDAGRSAPRPAAPPDAAA